MTNSTSDRTGDERRHDAGQGITVEQAAAALGITVAAVRKRLERGQLSGERQGRRWIVFLDDDPPPRPAHGATGDRTQDKARQDAGQGELDVLRQYVDTLKDQLAIKDQQVMALSLTVERLTRALPAPTDAPAVEVQQPSPRPWWARWRR